MKNFEIWLIISLTVCYLHRLLHMNTCVIKKRTLSKSIYSLLNNVHLYSSSILRTHLESMESTNNNLPINYLLSHLQNQERIQLQSWKCRN